MKVLLLQDVKKIGKKYDVKEVSDGYARNFLIPKKLAMPADEKAMSLKADAENKEKELLAKLKDQAKKVSAEILEFRVKTGSKGEVFGSVSAEQIKKALQDRGFEKAEVVLDQPLRTLGDYGVEIKFGRGITASVTVKLLSQS